MYRGSYTVTIDAKGRFAIPASYRQGLIDACGGRMVVTQHWDGCLLVYPQDRFQAFESELLSKGGLNNQVRNIQRFFLGNARDIDMDRQGRLLLPANLRDYAGLDARAVLAGMGHLFELWNEADWQASTADIGGNLAAQAAADELPDTLRDLQL